ncbi:universal stress protein [Bacillus sp. UMB0893]|uniref:universal stress protein n=1 Tax=Bacillus sp. UMB0893 TaxID=2066053 RepID=UPI000C76CA19|nr:universal stress protein [Bacillus sp. UMB0893]PLR67497.1 stress protein [Bacillus sp. UMB0893]
MITMKTFKHIVIAFDGHGDSQEALKTGIDLCKQLDSRLTVVHVFEQARPKGVPPVIPATPSNGYLADNLQNYPIAPDPSQQFEDNHNQTPYYDNSDEIVSQIRMKLDENQVAGEIEILSGSPSDAILHFAEEKNADLIVMGSRDTSGLKKLIFGSVSEKVSHNSTIPVFIAK